MKSKSSDPEDFTPAGACCAGCFAGPAFGFLGIFALRGLHRQAPEETVLLAAFLLSIFSGALTASRLRHQSRGSVKTDFFWWGLLGLLWTLFVLGGGWLPRLA